MPMLDPMVRLPKPHAGQTRIIETALRYNVVRCGRRFGKTKFGVGLAAEFAIDGLYVGWIVPSYKYFDEAWDELIELLQPLIISKDKSAGRIKLSGGGRIDLWSTHNNPDVCRGRKYHIVIVDEAALIDRLIHIWDNSIRASLTDFQGEAWFLSTPKGYNDFESLFERGERGVFDWASWSMGTATNPFVPAEEVEAAKRELPKAVYEQEYLGIPAPDGGNPFDRQAIEDGRAPLSDEPPVCYGVDIAASVDYTVVVGLDSGGRTSYFDRFQGASYESITPRIADAIGPRPALIDATGVGRPVVDRLRDDLGCVGAQPFIFTSQSKQRLIEDLVFSVHRREIYYPEEIASELRAFRYAFKGSRVIYEAGTGHDDGVCALALADRLRREWIEPDISIVDAKTDRSSGTLAQEQAEDRRFWRGE